MKIFLDTTYRRDPKNEKYYHRIYACIEKMGHKHLFRDIAENLPLALDQTSNDQERTKAAELYKKRLEYLHTSDINVFEASIPSLSTGLLIEKSLDMNKPTLVFYTEDHQPVLISGIENDKLLLVAYNDQNLEKIVEKAIINASQFRDKRFNFFISPGLLEYLENTSKKMGITKSTFIRNLILKHMKNN